jgi:hypothetical protein
LTYSDYIRYEKNRGIIEKLNFRTKIGGGGGGGGGKHI